jgi:hypothetical protein
MKILEIQHRDKEGNVLWHARNLLNLLHADGEEFLLRAAFTGGKVSTIIPDNYYLGLDNRPAIALIDTMDEIFGEPSGSGYTRQQVASSGDFAINFEDDHYLATSPIVAFRATGTGWGPVLNLFITTASDDTGYLISSVVLPSPVTLSADDQVTMRIGMQVKDCPVISL